METALNFIYIVFASIFVLFLPGLSISFAFFKLGQIDLIERIALSFALSISVVPLMVFYTNLLGVPIKPESVFAETLIIILVGVVIYIYRNKGVKIKLPFFGEK